MSASSDRRSRWGRTVSIIEWTCRRKAVFRFTSTWLLFGSLLTLRFRLPAAVVASDVDCWVSSSFCAWSSLAVAERALAVLVTGELVDATVVSTSSPLCWCCCCCWVAGLVVDVDARCYFITISRLFEISTIMTKDNTRLLRGQVSK